MQNQLSMFTQSQRFISRAFAAFLGMIALSTPAFAAGLPQMEDPSRGRGSGILQTLQNYGYDIVMLVALIVIACMFIGVCYHAYMVYADIQNGKKTWGNFGLTVAVGAMLLVVGVWLLTQGTGIL